MEPRATTTHSSASGSSATSPECGASVQHAGNLSWRAHPAAQRPAQAILAIGIILVVAGFVFVTTASVGLAVLGTVLLIAALNRFFFPSRFAIDEEGITAEYPLKRIHHKWKDLQRFVWDEYGGYLSTRAAPSRLDAYRGMHLLFDESERDQTIARIREKMGASESLQKGGGDKPAEHGERDE